MTEQFGRDPACDLCKAEKMTPWFHEDDLCWIAECDVCAVPMVVWRFHGVRPPAEHLAHMRALIAEVATREVGEFYIDDVLRNIPEHWHAHARPKDGFFGPRSALA
jgi:hypothetical protein